MEKFTDLLWVGAGSALGGMGRYFLAGLIDHRCASRFPWGTIVVNITGCFLMGLLAAWLIGDRPASFKVAGRLFLLVGLLGGYTTFSAFSWQTFQLMRDGSWLGAGANIGLSVVLSLVAVTAGHALGTWLQRSS